MQNEMQKDKEYIEVVLDIRRVAKVIRGGRRFSFSALVVVGDGQGQVGVAMGKGRDASAAISKALKKARKSLVQVPFYGTTIPYGVEGEFGASKVVLRSACEGTGVIAGGAVRAIMEAAGVRDVLSKIIGSRNAHNVAKATMEAIAKLRSCDQILKMRGKRFDELFQVRSGEENAESEQSGAN